MNKEQQDLAWQCLSKEARDIIRIAYKSDYVSDRGYYPTRGMQVLQKVFGYHNLTSNNEPSEMLFVERKKVQKKCNEVTKDYAETGDKWCSGYISALNDFFGDKCLPDKEPSGQVEPKQ